MDFKKLQPSSERLPKLKKYTEHIVQWDAKTSKSVHENASRCLCK